MEARILMQTLANLLAGIVPDGKGRHRHVYPHRPRDDTDADAGTHRANHGMMLMCFPAYVLSGLGG